MNMRPWVLALIVMSLGVSRALAAELTVTPEDAQASRAAYVTPETVKSWMDEEQSLVLLDVRAADEFTAGHIQSAINVVYDQIASLAEQLPREQPIILYCIHSAHRAPEAAKTLRQLGFQNAYVMEGGIVAWQAAGLPIRASDLAKTPTILPLTERCEELGAKSSEVR